ncbi:bifunctional 3-(3-hydroxy-phenyl)propionate/3-hydroxycinnamic acid hydroxylase [Hydrocarboniphaga sp.]|uniref:bifunctional 3-(3-hydroxy-phenyl)propionate/3-hydroxycinnamic acid hydroxylase n=1 Tax=Hydrocarboniphaga sp. TaxID=2033016 RepID=UPI003D101E7E
MATPIPPAVDVLIVGYGPVGAAVTLLLGRYGVSTLVVDKASDILTAPRAIALDNEALRILQMAGLSEDAFEKIAIPYVRMLCPQVGEFGRINTSGSIDGHPKLVTFYQPDLERALRRKAESCAVVSTLSGTEMLSFTEEVEGVRVVLRLADGDEVTVHARYLIGADGAGSKVRGAIGQDFRGKTYAEDWLIVDAQNVPGAFDHVEFICDSRRPTPHMIAPGGRVRWEFMLQPGETREEMEKDQTITRLLAPWATASEIKIERKAVYRFHARSCERYSKGRVFLVGDAAHITPPFAGQGLVAGLRDAANLSWKLAWVVKGLAAPAVLDTYDEERRPHATKMIALAKLMGRLVMPGSRPMAILIHGAMALLRRIPSLRTFLDELGVKPKNEFNAGLFVKGHVRLRRGGLLPQGLVRSASGEILLSDDALGSELSLVGFGLPAEPQLTAATLELWTRRGGRTVQFCLRGESVHRGNHVFEDMDNRLVPGGAPYGWCAVVRPDRTILHDGPVDNADRIVRESLALLGNSRPTS